jgi:hypothetical protein
VRVIATILSLCIGSRRNRDGRIATVPASRSLTDSNFGLCSASKFVLSEQFVQFCGAENLGERQVRLGIERHCCEFHWKSDAHTSEDGWQALERQQELTLFTTQLRRIHGLAHNLQGKGFSIFKRDVVLVVLLQKRLCATIRSIA